MARGEAEEGQSLEGFLQAVPFKVGTGEGVSYCFFITFGTALDTEKVYPNSIFLYHLSKASTHQRENKAGRNGKRWVQVKTMYVSTRSLRVFA